MVNGEWKIQDRRFYLWTMLFHTQKLDRLEGMHPAAHNAAL